MSPVLLTILGLGNAFNDTSIQYEGKPLKVIAFHGLPLTASLGGAIGCPTIRRNPNHVKDLSGSRFWQDLIMKSVKSTKPFNWMNPRVVIDLQDAKTIVIDQEARFIVIPTSLNGLEGWQGPVRERTDRPPDRSVLSRNVRFQSIDAQVDFNPFQRLLSEKPTRDNRPYSDPKISSTTSRRERPKSPNKNPDLET